MKEFLRLFMIFGGIILIIAGFYTIFGKNENISFNAVINNFVFFLSGAALIYAGIKRKNNSKQ